MNFFSVLFGDVRKFFFNPRNSIVRPACRFRSHRTFPSCNRRRPFFCCRRRTVVFERNIRQRLCRYRSCRVVLPFRNPYMKGLRIWCHYTICRKSFCDLCHIKVSRLKRRMDDASQKRTTFRNRWEAKRLHNRPTTPSH